MKIPNKIKVLFVAGFGPIIREKGPSGKFYVETLGLPLKEEGGYYHTGELSGVNHFALWPLASAAESCFGVNKWPSKIPAPHAWLEFDVESVEEATAELKSQGYEILVSARKEPWGQVVTRLLSPEGLLVGVTYTPWMRGEKEHA